MTLATPLGPAGSAETDAVPLGPAAGSDGVAAGDVSASLGAGLGGAVDDDPSLRRGGIAAVAGTVVTVGTVTSGETVVTVGIVVVTVVTVAIVAGGLVGTVVVVAGLATAAGSGLGRSLGPRSGLGFAVRSCGSVAGVAGVVAFVDGLR